MQIHNHSHFLQCMTAFLLLTGIVQAGIVVRTVPQFEKAAVEAKEGDEILVVDLPLLAAPV